MSGNWMDPGSARGSQAPTAPTNNAPLQDTSASRPSLSSRPRRSIGPKDYRQLAGKTPKSELDAKSERETSGLASTGQAPSTCQGASETGEEATSLKLKFRKSASGAWTSQRVEPGAKQSSRAKGKMSRNKARNGGPKEENEEELAMFSQIQGTLRKLVGIQKRQNVIRSDIMETEKFLADAESNRDAEAGPARDKLEGLYRELLKLTSEERGLLGEEPHDLIKNVEILAALRVHTENNPRGPQPPPPKVRKGKGSKSDIDVAVESPGPVSAIGASSTRIKGASGRSGSVPFSRETKESMAKADDSTGGEGAKAERAGKLVMGAEVAYKQAKPKEDGSQWIQCTIIAVNEIGNKKTYRVQDTEPDDQGQPGDVYKASAAALIAIPPKGSVLPDYPVAKHVLARYPDTSTFYRAEVTGMKKDICKLKFEDDMNQEMEVDRRYVLDMSSK